MVIRRLALVLSTQGLVRLTRIDQRLRAFDALDGERQDAQRENGQRLNLEELFSRCCCANRYPEKNGNRVDQRILCRLLQATNHTAFPARPLRLEFAGALYHVTSRGDGQEAIYRADGDRRMFLDVLGSVRERFNW